jgi:hypothetical protein
MSKTVKNTKVKRYVAPEGEYLDIFESSGHQQPYGYYIAWFLVEDGDVGGVLGDEKYPKNYVPKNEGSWSCYTATMAVDAFAKTLDSDRVTKGNSYDTWYFERRSDAVEALRQANAALSLGWQDKPMPEWAVTALAAGWTPPKGWKP